MISTNNFQGLVQIYTGNGKGKTSLALGIALRALGQGFRVCIIQFMKGTQECGENHALRRFLDEVEVKNFGKKCLYGLDCISLKVCEKCKYCFTNDYKQRQACKNALNSATKAMNSKKFDIVVLDEVLCGVSRKLILEKTLLNLIKKKPKKLELVLTGRNATKKIIKAANLVTEMKEVKHPFNQGIKSRRGIDF